MPTPSTKSSVTGMQVIKTAEPESRREPEICDLYGIKQVRMEEFFSKIEILYARWGRVSSYLRAFKQSDM
jgi:hypothetical protein